MDVLTQITQSALIRCLDQDKILILQIPDGRWHFPGGRLQANEFWEDGLRREVEEETAMTGFSLITCLAVDNWQSLQAKKPRYGVFFYCTIQKMFQPTLSKEHRMYKWIGIDDDLSNLTFHRPKMPLLIKQALSM